MSRSSILSHIESIITIVLYYFISLSTRHQLPPLMVASFVGCYLVKKCAEVAFRKHHRAMLAGDMVQEVGPVFHSELEQNARQCTPAIVS